MMKISYKGEVRSERSFSVKQHWKVLFMFTLFTCVFTLYGAITVSAKEYTGRIKNDGITWNYDDQTQVLTYYGTGKSTLNEIGFDKKFDTHIYDVDTIVIEGISKINVKLTADTIVLGKEVEQFMDADSIPTWETDGIPVANSRYVVDEDNVYFASYDDALYTKDLTELFRVPQLKTAIKLADTLEKIDSYAFLYTSLDQIVIPWG